MVKIIFYLCKSARPRQWIKNFALFAALVFSGELFVKASLLITFKAFVIFSILSSSIYLFNDVVDIPIDRKHPFKSKRPIASGKLPVPLALFAAILGFFISMTMARSVSFFFFLTCLAYLILQISYTIWIKHITILDLLAIATGFIIRVYAGALIINAHMSVWFLLAVISLSLFLAVAKRQSERILLLGTGGGLKGHRSTLTDYSSRLLDVYTGMFANTTWITYSLFTFLEPNPIPKQPLVVGLLSELPHTLVAQKWLMTTIPLMIYGIMRYLQIIYERNEGESPDRILISDKPLLTAVSIWCLMIVIIIYGIG